MKTFIFSLIIVLIFPWSACSNEILQISPDQQFKFAEKLFSQNNYSEAVIEYKRFIYFFPKNSKVKQAMFKTGMAYFNNKQYKQAVNTFLLMTSKYNNAEIILYDYITKAYFMISSSYIKLKAYGQAITNLHNLIMLTKDQNILDESYYKIGWIFIQTGNWENAERSFKKISAKNQDKYRLQSLSDKLNNAHKIPKKNPVLAGTLSIIPGAGFLYCGRNQDALTAFIINTGLMLAAYKAFDNDNPGLGGIISLVEMGFYTGNIYGAVSSAHKYNKNTTNKFIENLKKNTQIKVSAGIQTSFSFSLAYNF